MCDNNIKEKESMNLRKEQGSVRGSGGWRKVEITKIQYSYKNSQKYYIVKKQENLSFVHMNITLYMRR